MSSDQDDDLKGPENDGGNTTSSPHKSINPTIFTGDTVVKRTKTNRGKNSQV